MKRQTVVPFAVSLFSTLVALLSAAALVGRPARLVDALGLFASGFGAGAGAVYAVVNRRKLSVGTPEPGRPPAEPE